MKRRPSMTLRWAPRFRLRTLLVMLTLFGLALAPLSALVYRAERQRRAAAALLKQGCGVDYRVKGSWITVYHSRSQFPAMNAVGRWLGRDYAYTVVGVRAQNNGRAAVTAAMMPHLAELRDLERISIERVRLKNADLESLRGLRRLEEVYVCECGLEEGAIESLETLDLKWLSLRRTRVSDLTVRNLRKMRNLVHLDLDRTKISDESLVYLERLPQLRVLRIGRSKVTPEGARWMAQVSPGCQVSWEPMKGHP